VVKVKICGITNLEDALNSIDAGCDALGFVFYRKSPRYLTLSKARRLINNLPQQIIKIGVFVDAREKTVRRIAKLCKLNMLQFQGTESPGFCDRFKGYKIIKAFRIKNRLDLIDVLKYKTFASLFDTFTESRVGGTGRRFNWGLVRCRTSIKRFIFLSGGLTAHNVKEAIRTVHPQWVDVSSSVEIRPGKKDYNKLKEFIEAIRVFK
jgi:phosphoribosylanthranilate isomerase